MTYLYFVLVLCTYTNAHRRNEDVGVEHVGVPNAHNHVVHGAYQKYATSDADVSPSSRSTGTVEGSGAHSGHVTGKSSQVHGVEHSAAPQDVIQALQEISRRGFVMHKPPMPMQMHYQVPNVPRHPKFYGVGKSAHDETSEAEHESRRGSDGVAHHVEEEQHHHPHHVGAHEASRAARHEVGVHGAVHDGAVEAVRKPGNVRVSDAHEEATRVSEHSQADDVSRSSPFYTDEVDHNVYRSPGDVNMVNPVAYENPEDNRAGLYNGIGGMGGVSPFGGIGGIYGMGGANPFGDIGGIPNVPGGMKIYNIPHMPSPPGNQFPGYYGR